MLSGQGDVIEPTDGLCAIGSGGPYALAAARGLARHTSLAPAEICREAMLIAGEICVYSNASVTVLELDGAAGG
jgi:ATP-dependent HslUV protease subunit HslV